MLPKFDPNKIKVIHLRCNSGEVGATSVLAAKIGSLGLSPKTFDGDIAKATSDWKGLRIIVKLTCQQRQAQTDVVPHASALIINALKEPSRDRKKQHRSSARELSGTIRDLGTAQSAGCNVDDRLPRATTDDTPRGAVECPDS
ncbi:large ribosomal subunit protein uL11-like [Glossophaga mutica]